MELFEFTLNKTPVCVSQMTVHYSVGFIVLQHKRIPLTILTRTGMVMTGVLNGMMTGVLLDDTKVGNKRMTLPHAHFHLEFWILVP